jgi:hypothetical protein
VFCVQPPPLTLGLGGPFLLRHNVRLTKAQRMLTPLIRFLVVFVALLDPPFALGVGVLRF